MELGGDGDQISLEEPEKPNGCLRVGNPSCLMGAQMVDKAVSDENGLVIPRTTDAFFEAENKLYLAFRAAGRLRII